MFKDGGHGRLENDHKTKLTATNLEMRDGTIESSKQKIESCETSKKEENWKASGNTVKRVRILILS